MNNIDQMLADANAQAQSFTQAQMQNQGGQTFEQPVQAQPQPTQQAVYQQAVYQQQQPAQGQQQAVYQQQAPVQGHMHPQQQMMPAPAQQAAPQGQPQLPAHLQQYAAPMSFTMESMAAMGLSVEKWFKPDYQGMTVGDHDAIIREAIVEIDMTENVGFVLGMGLRYGNPAVYHFTTDGVSCQDGMSWPQALMTAMGVDPTAKPFRSVQIPMVAVQDIVDVDGKVVVTAGTSLGYTTPYSGWNTWGAFYRQVAMKGLLSQRVVVRLTNEPKKNAAGNKWGNLRYELIEQPAQA